MTHSVFKDLYMGFHNTELEHFIARVTQEVI